MFQVYLHPPPPHVFFCTIFLRYLSEAIWLTFFLPVLPRPVRVLSRGAPAQVAYLIHDPQQNWHLSRQKAL